MKRKVLLKWIIVDDYCACLIFEGGNPSNVEDRVAFIEKTPRVFIDGEWVQGNKGSGGNLKDDGYSIYGFYQPSRDWCEKKIAEHYETVVDNSFSEKFLKVRYENFQSKCSQIKNFDKFLNTFYYSKEDLEFTELREDCVFMSVPAISSNNLEGFLTNYDKEKLKFREGLEKKIKKEVDLFNSIISIKEDNGKICIRGLKNKVFKQDDVCLFLKELKRTKVSIVYKYKIRNNIESDKIVHFYYSKKNKKLTFEYRGIVFNILLNVITDNFSHKLRKILEKKNFFDMLNLIKMNFIVEIN